MSMHPCGRNAPLVCVQESGKLKQLFDEDQREDFDLNELRDDDERGSSGPIASAAAPAMTRTAAYEGPQGVKVTFEQLTRGMPAAGGQAGGLGGLFKGATGQGPSPAAGAGAVHMGTMGLEEL